MNFLARRGLLDGLGDGPGGTSSVGTPPASSTDGGLLGQIGSDIGGVGTAVNSLFSSVAGPNSSSSSSLSSSSSSTASAPPSSSSSSSLPSSSSSSSSSVPLPSLSSSLPVSSPPASTPAPSSSPPVSDAQTLFTTVTSSTAPLVSDQSAAALPPKSFLENKPLSGTIFGLIGLVVLIALVVFITGYVRRRSRNRLHDDAAGISWNPTDVEDMAGAPSEKLAYSASRSNHSVNRSNHGHGGYAASDQGSVTGPITQVPDATFARQDYGATNPGAYMPNPYNTYANPVYQPPRSTSPMYGGGPGAPPGNAYAGYPANNSRGYAYGDAPAPPSKDVYKERLPASNPLPDTFGEDVYGGITSVDLMENYTGNPHATRNLHVAN